MTKDEALRLAFEALKQIDEAMPFPVAKLAQAAIKEALANVATNDTSQERVAKTSESVQEPVAWISATELLVMRGNALGGAKDWRVNLGLEPEEGDVGLYTTPPQRKPLTDEKIYSVLENLQIMYNRPPTTDSRIIFARAIEAAHGIKEKNT